jgi:5-formyltetrahydrofolate cyclo-ligase
MSVKEEKRILRAKIRQLKENFSVEQKKESSIAIFNEIEKLDVFKNSNIILLYWSMEHEVFTHDFIKKWSNNKKILLPVIDADDLLLKEFSDERSLRKSEKFPVFEPQGDSFKLPNKIDLAIVPGVAFDVDYNRLGFGKGYYDRLLAGIKAFKIGVCFDFQLFNVIPREVTDVKMDLVISG